MFGSWFRMLAVVLFKTFWLVTPLQWCLHCGLGVTDSESYPPISSSCQRRHSPECDLFFLVSFKNHLSFTVFLYLYIDLLSNKISFMDSRCCMAVYLTAESIKTGKISLAGAHWASYTHTHTHARMHTHTHAHMHTHTHTPAQLFISR